MANHTFSPRHCLAEEGFFLKPLPWRFQLDSIPSLTNTKPFESVFLVLRLPRVLGLGPWPNICTNSGCLAFYPHRCKEKIEIIWHVTMQNIRWVMLKICCIYKKNKTSTPQKLWFSIELSFCYYNILETFSELRKMVTQPYIFFYI